MATKLAPVDVVIVGFGWTGGIIAKELAPTKLKIVALERGGPRDSNPDFIDPQRWDELRYAQRTDLMQDVRRETLTFRYFCTHLLAYRHADNVPHDEKRDHMRTEIPEGQRLIDDDTPAR